MTDETAYKLAKLIVVGFVILLFAMSYSIYSAYEGRVTLVKSQRAGCERGKLNNIANATGWRIAEDARRESGDTAVSIRYGQLAHELEVRAQINCLTAYPKARLIP